MKCKYAPKGVQCPFEKQLQERLQKAEIQLKPWQKGSEEWHQIACHHGYFILKELLDM